MEKKRSVDDDAEQKFRKRFKGRFLANSTSALQCHEDFKLSQEAGARGSEDLLNTKPGKHSKRDLLNTCLRDNEWPGLYWGQIPLMDLQTKGTKMTWVPFLWPHEWLPLYVKQKGATADLEVDEPELLSRLNSTASDLQVPFLVPLGLHGDGVPIGGNMTPDSLECFNLNMISSSKHSHLRIPFVCMQLKHCLPQETFDAIVKVLCWSMKALAAGKKPTCRHDGSAWRPSDKGRIVKPGESFLGVQAVLAELRGDWIWLQKLLKFPTWNTKEGLCWLCKCCPADMCVLDSSNASWRFQRLLPGEFLERCRQQGKPVNELFSLPGVAAEIVYPDWMHSGDLGVGQDVAGHTLQETLRRFPGSNDKQRCANLWSFLQEWYKDNGVEADRRIQTLHLKDFQRDKQPDKLRCKAAHTRTLVPFLPVLARHLAPDTERARAVIATADCLADCYKLMEQAPCQALAQASRKLANSYCALRDLALDLGTHAWHVKPKLHLFQELCEFSSRCPRDFWCYKDETFGNVCAGFGRRKGGRDHPGHNTKNLLLAWCCSEPLPRP